MPQFPTGIVTFVFTDIEGSTSMIQRLGESSYLDVLETHNVIIRAAFHAGVEIRTEGDSFFYVFGSAADAVAAASDAQRALTNHVWPNGGEVRVRMGMHTGVGTLGGGDYVSFDVNRAARIAAAGHGGQVHVSAATKSSAVTYRWTTSGRTASKTSSNPSGCFSWRSTRHRPGSLRFGR